MLNRPAVLLALGLIIGGCAPNTTSNATANRAAVETAVREWTRAGEAYDFTSMEKLVDSNTVWIEQGPPAPISATLSAFRNFQAVGVVIKTGGVRDLRAAAQGGIGWARWLIDVTFTTDNKDMKKFFRTYGGTTDPTQRAWSFTYAESAVLHQEGGAWRFVMGHTTRVPPAAAAK